MKLQFKQRMFSWLDSYDISNEYGEIVFSVKGQLSWGHMFRIYDAKHNEVGAIKERIISFMPKFEIIKGGKTLGFVTRKMTLLHPRYEFDFVGWYVKGSIMEWDYSIHDGHGTTIAVINKKLLALTDTYIIDVKDDSNALLALMFVLAIDAEKCSRN